MFGSFTSILATAMILLVLYISVSIPSGIPNCYKKKGFIPHFWKHFVYPEVHYHTTTKLMGKILNFEDVSMALNEWKSRCIDRSKRELPSCTIYVNHLHNGISASKMLQEQLKKSSKEVYRSCKNGLVTLNGTKIYATRKVAEGDVITIAAEQVQNISAEAIKVEQKKNELYIHRLKNFTNSLLTSDADLGAEGVRQPMLQVLYEDDFLAVVYKPAGLHTLQWVGTMKKQFFTLSDVLPLILSPPPRTLHHDGEEIAALERPLPCHRLDARVPGCVLVAKTASSLAALNSQFADRIVKKEYRAILVGKIDLQAYNNDSNNNNNSSSNLSGHYDGGGGGSIHILEPVGGRSAHTILRVIEQTPCNVYGTISHVALSPVTGRKHQLRQHCAWLGCPIMGDDLYHSAAFFPSGEPRREAIARAEAGEKENDEGDSGDREEDQGGGGEGGRDHFDGYVSPQRLPRDVPRVRKGVGLLLMSTSIEFRHPFPRYIAENWVRDTSQLRDVEGGSILESVTMEDCDDDVSSHRVRVRIRELKKYSRILDKAAKGALFKAQTESTA